MDRRRRMAGAVALAGDAAGAEAQVQWTGPGSNGHYCQVFSTPAGIT